MLLVLDVTVIAVIGGTTVMTGGRMTVAALTATVAETMTAETEIVAVTMTGSKTATGTAADGVAVTAEVVIIGGRVAAKVGVEMPTDVDVTKVTLALRRQLSSLFTLLVFSLFIAGLVSSTRFLQDFDMVVG